MKTLIRTLIWLVGIVALLFVAAGVAITFYFDPNDYKSDIEAVIESNTGREVTIEGDLSLSVFPCCAIELGRVELSNPDGFEPRKFLSIDSAEVSIGLLPLLLRQKIVIGEVVLEGFDATLITRSDGSVNWEFSADAPENVIEAAEPVPENDAPVTMNELSIEGLRFIGGRLRWLDETADTDILVTDLNVVTGPVVADEPFDLTAGFTVAGLAEGIDADFSFSGKPTIDQSALTIDLGGSVIELLLQGKGLPGGEASITVLAPHLLVGGTEEDVSARDLTVDLAAGPFVLRAKASGSVADAGVNFAGSLETDVFSPRELLKLLDTEMETADPKALSAMDIRSDWVFRGDRAGLSKMVLHLDDTTISGELGLGSIENEQILADLTIDTINLDRYLEPESEVSTTSAPQRSSDPAAEEELIPVETLRDLNVKASIKVSNMVISDIRLSDVSLTVAAQGGSLRINPLMARLYEGAYSGDIRVDVRGKQPKVSFNEKLTGVKIGGLLSDNYDISNIEGLLNIEFAATSKGNTESALIAGLNGNVSFNLADAVYQGRDFWYELRSQKARLSGKSIPPAPQNPKTDISKMQGSGVITQGIMRNNDLAMQVPFIRLNGVGQTNLSTLDINYKLDAKVIGSPQFDDGSNLDELNGLTLPVTISGAADDPDIAIDLTSVITGLATKKLQDRLLKKYGGAAPTADPSTSEEPLSDRDARKQLLRKGLGGLLR